jgi:dTDP-4-dehydrorhamnose 3,5-epimerase-like enzyme
MEKEAKIINLPKFLDDRGNLSFLEAENHIPFRIKRAYWIYDVPGGEIRGGHAYKTLSEFIIAIAGSFDVIIDDGTMKKTFHLNRSYYGLYVPEMMWRQMENFSTNSLGLVLASDFYNEEDYLRDYKEFLSNNNHHYEKQPLYL